MTKLHELKRELKRFKRKKRQAKSQNEQSHFQWLIDITEEKIQIKKNND